jgi:beta-barrel assembly-enhancing protease
MKTPRTALRTPLKRHGELKRHATWLSTALLCSALTAPPAVHAQGPATPNVRLPTLGDSVSDELDVVAERKLGDQVMREIRRDPDVLDDPLLLAYVQSIWRPLMRAASQQGDINSDTQRAFAWEAFLIRDRAVNAFALPGGFIGVYLGLVGVTASRDELAAVLAHEMAHVTQRHIARSMTNSARTSMVGLAAMLAAVLVASKSNNANAAQAAVMTGQAAMIQGQLNFSRDMEREADRVGYSIFTGGSFAPGGVAAMFEKLEAANRLNDSGAFPYLRSHPLTIERIGDARARVDAAQAARSVLPTLEHEVMRARARVLMDSRAESLRRWQTNPAAMKAQASTLANEPTAAASVDRIASHYASGLASLQLRDADAALTAAKAAQQALRTLAKRDASAERAVRLLLAQSMAMVGQSSQAIAMLDEQGDSHRAAMITRAAIATDAARSGTATANAPQALRESMEALQSWVTDHRDDALAWQHLARTHEQLGFKLRALRADAEASAALGDVNGALDRMRAGQRFAREAGPSATDAIEAAVIDARARELAAIQKELLKDLRQRP